MTQEWVPLSDWRNVIHEDVVADGLEVEEDAVEEAERQERSIIGHLEQKQCYWWPEKALKCNF